MLLKYSNGRTAGGVGDRKREGPHKRTPRRAAPRNPRPPPIRHRRRAHQRPLTPLAPRLGEPPRAHPRRRPDRSRCLVPRRRRRRACRLLRRPRQRPQVHRAVDGALAAYSAAHANGLKITAPYGTPAHRVASWLRFASRRLAGALHLHLCLPRSSDQWKQWRVGELHDLQLPPCEGATSIEFNLYGARFLVRPQPPPPGGVMFAALTDLEIRQATMEGRALGALVSTQCPRLRKLRLALLTQVAASDVSIRSGSLRNLEFTDVLNTLRLHVAAPALQVLSVKSDVAEAYVAAPSLAEVVWSACPQFVFADSGRHLRRLVVTRCSAMAPLMRRFDLVDELRLHHVGEDGCKTFLDDATNTLPKCRTLWVSLMGNNHGFVPTVLRLLGRGNDIKKLCMSYTYIASTIYSSRKRLCRAPKSSMTDYTIPDSLEEIEIDFIRGSEDVFLEFLKQLLSNIWSMAQLKSVEINMFSFASSLSDVVYERIRAMCSPNISIRTNAFSKGRRRQFYSYFPT